MPFKFHLIPLLFLIIAIFGIGILQSPPSLGSAWPVSVSLLKAIKSKVMLAVYADM